MGAAALIRMIERLLGEKGHLTDEEVEFIVEKANALGDEGQRVLARLEDSLPDEHEADVENGISGAPVVAEKEEEEPNDPAEIPEIPLPKLASNQIDIPEEPEEVDVVLAVYANGQWTDTPMGKMLLVPTGCEEPEELSPYESIVSLRSALPRDKEKDMNLFQAYRNNGLVSREWIRENLDEDIDGKIEDKRIADDIPVMLAMQGIPETGGVAQTAGMDPGQPGAGSNNGAPLPAKPGPGRGNKFAPGDGLGGPKTPT
jgi:hypothetical protein